MVLRRRTGTSEAHKSRGCCAKMAFCRVSIHGMELDKLLCTLIQDVVDYILNAVDIYIEWARFR